MNIDLTHFSGQLWLRCRAIRTGLVVWCLWGQAAQAVIIEPTVLAVDINHSGGAQIILTNTATENMPVEVSLRRIYFHDNDDYVISDEPHPPFLVFPPAVMLEPGQSQVFRLQWLGKKLSASESYFVRFTRLTLKPLVPELSEISGISVQIHYNALVHFFSADQQPVISLQVDVPGTATVINQGSRYGYLSQFRFVCPTTSTPPVVIDELSRQTGERFLPPGQQVQLTLPQTILPCKYDGVLR